MSLSRIYQAQTLHINTDIDLDERATQYLVKALRLKPDDSFILFNGDGKEYIATLLMKSKRKYAAHIVKLETSIAEPTCHITLGQGISRGERMDYAIQKAVELGVFAIQPLITTRIAVKLSSDSFEKRRQHWQGIAISACEQSGRATVPEVFLPMTLEAWLPSCQQALRLILDPTADNTLPAVETPKDIALVIGPEGGLTDHEVKEAKEKNFLAIKLGPRILRTETAAITAMTLLQHQWGDLR